MFTITQELVDNINKVLDHGLVSGLGYAEPGKFCVEAAICYCLGLPHSDKPGCVAPSVRALKIRLNDARWSNKMVRAKGLRKLAILQLGTKDNFDEVEFAKRLVPLAKNAAAAAAAAAANATYAATAADAAATAAADAATTAATYAATAAAAAADAAAATAAAAAYAAYAAYAAAANVAAANAAADKILKDFAEGVEKILIDMGVPGAAFI